MPVTTVINVVTAPVTQPRDAYQLAVVDGFTGTREEWYVSLGNAPSTTTGEPDKLAMHGATGNITLDAATLDLKTGSSIRFGYDTETEHGGIILDRETLSDGDAFYATLPGVTGTVAVVPSYADKATGDAAVDAGGVFFAQDTKKVHARVGSVISKTVIDDATAVYADGDAAGAKVWTVSAGTGTSSGDGSDHTLTATTGNADTTFVRDVSLDARYSAFEFEFEKDANLSQIKFGVAFGTQAALKYFNLAAWGVTTYLYAGKYVKVVVSLAEMNVSRTAGWTQEMLRNCKQISFTIRPTAGNTTAVKLRKVTHVQSDGIGRVCFQFDDNNETTHTTAEPILTENGYAGDIAVEYESIGNAGRGSLAQLQARYAQGWGMLGHGATQFTSLTEAQQIAAHKAIKDVLVGNGFHRGSGHFVWPGGAATTATDDIAARFWKTRRRVARVPEVVMPGAFYPAQPNHIYLQTGFSTTTVKGLMDEAKAHGAAIVLTIHGVLDTPVAAEDISTAKFTEIVEYAASIGLVDARYDEIFIESP